MLTVKIFGARIITLISDSSWLTQYNPFADENGAIIIIIMVFSAENGCRYPGHQCAVHNESVAG